MIRRFAVTLALSLAMLALSGAEAGHELPFYPSFYPQGIKIERLDRTAAAAELTRSTLHAYLGADPFTSASLPESVTRVESLGSYVIARFDAAASPAFADAPSRCAFARALGAARAPGPGDYVDHPYPVTPFHADYLQHVDLAHAAKREVAAAPAAAAPAGARVESIDVDALLGSRRIAVDGWAGPPWLKAGWFHAYLLHAPTIRDATRKQAVDGIYTRLTSGRYAGPVERFELERTLVSALRSGCERVVLGYTVKREAFSSEYSQGVENVGYDSHDGLTGPLFVRTVKLKDFPWNGWLRVGVGTPARAAWNPLAGFTDPAGRLIWSAIGDPGLLAAPHGPGWLPNRVTASVTRVAAGMPIPADARVPEPGTGLLIRVGPGKRAAVRIEYRVRASLFHDGTRMTVADALYPFALAYRWGVKSTNGTDYDPAIDAATALARDRLAGVRPVKVETLARDYGDVKFVYDVPVIEVYLNPALADADAIDVAPPWSAVPWPVLALMEEAARRGLGAFSEPAATARGVAWLDLVRDARLSEALGPIVERFRRQGYVPPALRGMVSAGQARQRWAALASFRARSGHFLVTNGPYRLRQWSTDSTTLDVFRDMTYPLGVGSFDEYVFPLRAHVSAVDARSDRIEVHVAVDRLSKFARSYEIVREPFTATPSSAPPGAAESQVPRCRYLAIGPGGEVVRAGLARRGAADVFVVPLDGLPNPGRYTILIGLELGGTTNPEITRVDTTLTP